MSNSVLIYGFLFKDRLTGVPYLCNSEASRGSDAASYLVNKLLDKVDWPEGEVKLTLVKVIGHSKARGNLSQI